MNNLIILKMLLLVIAFVGLMAVVDNGVSERIKIIEAVNIKA
jgi:hypothetical protein